MTHSIKQIYEKIFSMNNHVSRWLLLILLLCTTPLYAEINYLYVSDIIKKRALPHQAQSNYGSSWQNGAERYKYNDYYLNQPMEHRQAVNIPDHISYSSDNKIPQVYQYPVKNHINHFGNRIYKPSNEIERMTTPKNSDEQYKKTYFNVQYVSDLEPIRRIFRKKNKTMLYEFQNKIGHTKSRDSIRYIPDPIYDVPKMLSGNISDILTSEHMVPVYSDFKPDYNSGGLNNIYGIPNNSLSRFGIFSRQ